MKQMMNSWQIHSSGFESLQLVKVPVPIPASHQLLIKVAAVALNYRDKLVIEGKLLSDSLPMPFTPASDMAGEVVATGPGVSRFNPGDRVIGNFWTQWLDGNAPLHMARHGQSLGGPLPGVLSEYIVLHEDVAVAAPVSLSDAQAATLPVAGLTAWFALVEAGKLQAGDRVLVQGTGGVALAALQLAQAMGAEVSVISRSAEKLQRARALGASSLINTSITPLWASQALALTDGQGFDHILELIGGENVRQSVAALAPAGRIAQIGFLQGGDITLPALPLMLKRGTIQGITVGHRRALADLSRAMDRYAIKPVIDQLYDFSQVKAAFEHLERGPFGKVVVAVG